MRNVRYQVAFLTISRLFKTFTYSSNDIISFDIDRYTFDEVKKTWLDLQKVTNIDSRCATWRSKSVSLEITKSIADIEKIKNFVAIDTIQNKKKKGGKNGFTDEFLEEVKKNLPAQPWPKGVHLTVSRKMGISPQKRTKAYWRVNEA